MVAPAVHFAYHQDAHIQCSSPVCAAVRAETWPLTGTLSSRLDGFDSFHSRALRSILGLRWRDLVSNEMVRALAGQPPASSLSARRRVRWYGHVLRIATAPSYPGLRHWLVRLEATPRSPTHPLDWRGQTRSWPARPRSSRNWTPRAGPWWMAASRESGWLYARRAEGTVHETWWWWWVLLLFLRPLATDVYFENCITKPTTYDGVFLLFSSAYNVLSWTEIVLNNFIQCSHCQVAQLFRPKSLNLAREPLWEVRV